MARLLSNGADFNGKQGLNLLLHNIAGSPGSPTESQVWYDTGLHRARLRIAAANVTLITDGGDLSANSVAITAVNGFDTQVRTSRLDQMATPTSDVAWGSHKITGLLDPTSAQDAATKNYVDLSITGFSWKNPVRVATTANGTLATAYANGSTVDSVTLATGNRILLKNQTAGGENGIYTVNASGAPTRAIDNDSSAEMQGAAVMVEEGTANQNTQWIQTVDGAITIGTTTTTWTQFGGAGSYSAGNGITLTGSVFSVTADTGIVVSGTGVAVDHTKVPYLFAATFGDGSTTSFTHTHNLGTRDVITSFYAAASTWDEVEPDVQHTTTNTITSVWGVAPTTNQYRVVVHG